MATHNNSADHWFESLAPPRTPLVRLFCFPYGGGNAYAFRDWQRHFAPEIEICLVHLPGRARRISEPLYTRLQPLVRELANVICSEINGRFAFYGHSMGALISFELARELRRRNFPVPMHLFLSACRAPTAVRAVPSTYDLPRQEFMAKIQTLNGTPREVFEHPEIQNALLPLLRADFEITDTYEYVAEGPLDCPITAYGGDHDELAALKNVYPWELETSAECKVRVFTGGHFFIQSHKTEFIQVLREDLLRTLSEKASRRRA